MRYDAASALFADGATSAVVRRQRRHSEPLVTNHARPNVRPEERTRPGVSLSALILRILRVDGRWIVNPGDSTQSTIDSYLSYVHSLRLISQSEFSRASSAIRAPVGEFQRGESALLQHARPRIGRGLIVGQQVLR